jgi:hypothetical protein
MTLLSTSRSRIAAISLAFAVVAFLCLAFARQIASVHAAKLMMLGSNGRPIAELASNPAAETPSRPNSTPVLVELFTSEGCSSCPPADGLLARLQSTQPVPNAGIIALEEHVDYWDSLGWKDRFSSHQLTARQSAYAQRLHLEDVFTPQMIVDGTDQFTGNDSAHAQRAILGAARTRKLALSLSQPSLSNGHIAAKATLARSPAPVPNADVFAALIDPMASTRVLNGENGGRTLQHVSVVRSLQRIGSLASLATSPLNFSLDLPSDAPDPRIVVFIQSSGQGAILGAATSATSLPSASISAAH